MKQLKKHKGLLLGLIMVTSVLLAACGSSTSSNNDSNDKISIMTTFYPMYEFTQQVVGKAGDVELLIPAGTEPHDYEPSAKDLAKISDADMFVYNSPELETWTDNLSENIDTSHTTIVKASKGISLMEGSEEEGHTETEEGHEHELDPHVWLDPVLAVKEVETIRDALVKKYPEQKATFKKNAAAYIKKLEALNTKYETALADASNKTFVTQHAAFGYLAKQYGLTQDAIAGISPDQEPSASRLSELKTYVEENNIEVIYFEENATSKVAETLANETGVKLAVLNPLESLTSKQIKAGEDYISVMEENLAALQESIK